MDHSNDIHNLSGVSLFRELRKLFFFLIGRDRSFLAIAMVYGLAISLLTLAVPMSVQMLVNSVAHIASTTAVILLSSLLLFVMLLYAGLNALQTYMMELFERRFYARITSEFTLRSIYAEHAYYENINRYELVNRYFDIMNVQKTVPNLIIGLFAIFLQMVVGVTLVSLYHPWLMLFNLTFLSILYTIWRLWGYRAMKQAINLSDAKYCTARHLEDIARANSFFKSDTHISYAIDKIDHLTNDYIDARKKLFRLTFSQHIALLLLYAFASAGLLSIGGLQVVYGELTLGQLVAAELILSTVFYSVSNLGAFFKQIYGLGASLEEIYRVFDVPLETMNGSEKIGTEPTALVFENAVLKSEGYSATFNFRIDAGKKIMADTAYNTLQNMLLDSVKRYVEAEHGSILIGNTNILDHNKHDLRDHVIVLDRTTVIEATIREYLMLGKPDASISEMNDALELMELESRIQSFPDGLDTMLTVTGSPLTVSETLRLKLAGALMKKPHILILNEFFDTISYTRRKRIFKKLYDIESLTLVYFSNREDLDMFDDYLFVDKDAQYFLGNVQALREYDAAHDEEGNPI